MKTAIERIEAQERRAENQARDEAVWQAVAVLPRYLPYRR
jgi:hypothetical protein